MSKIFKNLFGQKTSRSTFYAPPDSASQADLAAIRTAVEIMDDWDSSNNAKVSIEADNVGLAQESGGNLDTIAGDTTAIETAIEIMDDWDATQNSAVSADGPQVMTEAKDFDGAAFPNNVTEGNAVRPAASQYGVQYFMPVSEDGSQSPYDNTNDLLKIQEQAPQWSRYTDVATLVGTAQDLTASFADLGSEIDCRGYRYCRLFLTVDINNSVNPQIKILGKHTSAGSEEYPCDPNKWTVRDSTLAADGSYRELDTDGDDLYIVEIELDNAMPYLQIQAKVGTVGAPTAGQIDKAYYTLGY